LGDVAALRQTKRSNTKTELVILLKPTVVQEYSDWSQDILDVQKRVQAMSRE
jgi:type II secretory pathway component GspD/PulD (secretin)